MSDYECGHDDGATRVDVIYVIDEWHKMHHGLVDHLDLWMNDLAEDGDLRRNEVAAITAHEVGCSWAFYDDFGDSDEWQPAIVKHVRRTNPLVIYHTYRRVLKHLQQQISEVIDVLEKRGADEHGIRSLSAEAWVSVRVDVLDYDFTVTHEDECESFVPLPTDGITFGIRAELGFSDRLLRALGQDEAKRPSQCGSRRG